MNPVAELLQTEYGPMIVAANDVNQTEALRKTGRGVHHDVVMMLCRLLDERPPNRVVVDAGANIGAFTIPLSAHIGEDGWLYAFEPQPILCNMLAGNIALSQQTNVRAINACLGAAWGALDVPQYSYRHSLNFGSIEFGGEQVEPLSQNPQKTTQENRQSVNVMPLDSLNFSRLDLFKIDVQRMEIDVLAGARETIARCKPIIFIEWLGYNPDTLRLLLKKIGYRVVSEHSDDWLCYPE